MNNSDRNQRQIVTDTVLMTAIRKQEPRATTSDIASEIGLSYQITRYRLNRLESLGDIESETGDRTELWHTV